ncbi:GGDEF domain-containing protein [Devosia psychrophila]|uniref:diguanylate cyclase n=2 Tax=Devosia psychrophila TaxID=728005 RepID=A0A1I1P9R2_9HYPH|nr:GGDEF domain-containing protein [Devosia psychrophila]SFD06577.1 diguanylate cyclase (GGDEF) domain-containing protein [Devosia psychrophila]
MDTFSNFAFLLPTTMTLFGLVFLVIGGLSESTASAWGVAFIFGAASFVAPVLPMPVMLQSLFGNATILVSFFYYGEALLRHFGAPRLIAVRLIFSLLAYASLIVAIVGAQSRSLELATSDVAVALLLGGPLALVIWRARSLMDRVLVGVAAIAVIDILVRLFIFNGLNGMSTELADFAGSSYTYYAQVNVGVLSVAFAMAGLGSVTVATLETYRHAAERDPLTGLLNRRGFDSAVASLSMAQRVAGIVMTCDIDNFKQVNDSSGHASGDAVLAGLAALLLSRLPSTALVARFGGEEFVVFLLDMPLASGAALGQSIRADFSASDWRSVGVQRQITMSLGVAAPVMSENSMHEALARADRALYAAKSAGRNQVVIDAGDSYVPGLRIAPAA